MCTAESKSGCDTTNGVSASSNTIESTPPERATATRAPAFTCSASAVPIAAATAATALAVSARGDFLELAIAEQLVLARVEQHVERAFLRMAQRLGQGFLERRHHRRVIPMCTARRLRHDLVDEPESLQALRRDAQRFGSFLGMLGRFPQDRRAAFRRDNRV